MRVTSKKNKYGKIPSTVLLIFLGFLCQSCIVENDGTDDVYESSAYDPIILDRSQLDASISITNPMVIGTSGKIYVKDQFLLINDVHKGFHIYDNTDPGNPQPLKFLKIPGATDVAIRENVFYINQATDLVALEFDGIEQTINITKRVVNTFPELESPDGFIVNVNKEDEVVVGWVLKK